MANKYCHYCDYTTRCIKYGTTSAGKQKYKCTVCGKIWTNKNRPKRLEDKIWHDFVFRNFTADSLSEKYHKSVRKIYDILENYQVSQIVPPDNFTCEVVCMNVTYVKRKYGFLIVLDAHSTKCLYCAITRGYETTWDFEKALLVLHSHGIFPKAVVIDGKKSVIQMFENYGLKVQFYQFHMQKLATKYLTKNPVLLPNKELRATALMLTRVNKAQFEQIFYGWIWRHGIWLEE